MWKQILTREQISTLVALIAAIFVAAWPVTQPFVAVLEPVIVALLFAVIGIPAAREALTAYVQYRLRIMEAQSRGIG